MLFGLDAYALTYGGSALMTVALTMIGRDRAGVEPSCVILALWLSTVSFQKILDANSITSMFAVIDLMAVVTFSVMAFLYDRVNLWVVAGLHFAMTVLHVTVWISPNIETFTYLSILTILGYVSMIVLAFPSLLTLVGFGHDRRVDYHGFMSGQPLRAHQVRSAPNTKVVAS